MVYGLCSPSVFSFPNSFITDRVDDGSDCVIHNWASGYVRCVLVVLEGGIYSLLCGENSICMLEGFFNYSRECLVYLFEFFLGHDPRFGHDFGFSGLWLCCIGRVVEVFYESLFLQHGEMHGVGWSAIVL
jgi:hypothetical protein